MKSATRKLIALLEIVGGATGPIYIGFQLYRGEPGVSDVTLVPVNVVIYLFALYAGVSLWLDRQRGYWMSIWVQLIQLPKLQSPAFLFSMSFGFDVPVVMAFDEIHRGVKFSIYFILGSEHMRMNQQSDLLPGFGASLVSLVVLPLLHMAHRRRCLPDEQNEMR